MIRNVLGRIDTDSPRLVMCIRTLDGYEEMHYYIAMHTMSYPNEKTYIESDDCRGFGDGFFIANSIGRYDFFPIDEFNDFFLLADERENKINKVLYFLKSQRKFKVKIEPIITCDGYFYEYNLWIWFPFIRESIEEYGFASYIEAAKRLINIAREESLKRHAKDGISFWLEYAKVKKH